jgi:hypothetical protein
MLRRRRLLVGTVIAFVFVASGVGVTYAAFSKTTSNPGSVVTARPDWKPPTVSATTVKKANGYLTGYVKQDGDYHVYANVAEPSSNPAAGVASVTADMSALTGVETAVPLTTTGGPWTVEGVSYNYRSAQLTADTPITPEGSKNWSLVATDAATPTANATSALPYTATVDNTAPSAANIATTNSGTARRPTIGDTVTFTYNAGEKVDPESILTGWTGAQTNVTVRVIQAGGSDRLEVWNTANSGSALPFGTINLGRTDYVTATAHFGPSTAAVKSTMTLTNNTITVVLGTNTAGTPTTAGAGGNISWTPSTTAYDRAGNAASTANFTQSGNGNDF